MSGSGSRRRVTVDREKSLTDSAEKRKPSVFERLGPGAPTRSFESGERDQVCIQFVKQGWCNYGSTCKFSHPASSSSDDLRRKMSRKRKDKDSQEKTVDVDSGSDPERESTSGKDKEGKIRSTVVSKGEETDLDFDATLKLERRRQQIKKQLSLLEEEERKREKEKDEPSVDRPGSDDSEGLTMASGSKKSKKEKAMKSPPFSGDDPTRKKSKKKKTKHERRRPSRISTDEEKVEKKDKKHHEKEVKKKPKAPSGKSRRSRSSSFEPVHRSISPVARPDRVSRSISRSPVVVRKKGKDHHRKTSDRGRSPVPVVERSKLMSPPKKSGKQKKHADAPSKRSPVRERRSPSQERSRGQQSYRQAPTRDRDRRQRDPPEPEVSPQMSHKKFSSQRGNRDRKHSKTPERRGRQAQRKKARPRARQSSSSESSSSSSTSSSSSSSSSSSDSSSDEDSSPSPSLRKPGRGSRKRKRVESSDNRKRHRSYSPAEARGSTRRIDSTDRDSKKRSRGNQEESWRKSGGQDRDESRRKRTLSPQDKRGKREQQQQQQHRGRRGDNSVDRRRPRQSSPREEKPQRGERKEERTPRKDAEEGRRRQVSLERDRDAERISSTRDTERTERFRSAESPPQRTRDRDSEVRTRGRDRQQSPRELDRNRRVSPAVSRRGVSPAESLRSLQSARPVSPTMVDRDRRIRRVEPAPLGDTFYPGVQDPQLLAARMRSPPRQTDRLDSDRERDRIVEEYAREWARYESDLAHDREQLEYELRRAAPSERDRYEHQIEKLDRIQLTARENRLHLARELERTWDDQRARQGLLDAIRERERARIRLYGDERGRLVRDELEGPDIVWGDRVPGPTSKSRDPRNHSDAPRELSRERTRDRNRSPEGHAREMGLEPKQSRGSLDRSGNDHVSSSHPRRVEEEQRLVAERLSRRQQWEQRRDDREHPPLDPYLESGRKPLLEDDLSRSPNNKRRRNLSPTESHHSGSGVRVDWEGADRQEGERRLGADWDRERPWGSERDRRDASRGDRADRFPPDRPRDDSQGRGNRGNRQRGGARADRDDLDVPVQGRGRKGRNRDDDRQRDNDDKKRMPVDFSSQAFQFGQGEGPTALLKRRGSPSIERLDGRTDSRKRQRAEERQMDKSQSRPLDSPGRKSSQVTPGQAERTGSTEKSEPTASSDWSEENIPDSSTAQTEEVLKNLEGLGPADSAPSGIVASSTSTEERSRRSPSHSSLGSRHSHRDEDRDGDRRRDRDRDSDRGRGGRGRDRDKGPNRDRDDRWPSRDRRVDSRERNRDRGSRDSKGEDGRTHKEDRGGSPAVRENRDRRRDDRANWDKPDRTREEGDATMTDSRDRQAPDSGLAKENGHGGVPPGGVVPLMSLPLWPGDAPLSVDLGPGMAPGGEPEQSSQPTPTPPAPAVEAAATTSQPLLPLPSPKAAAGAASIECVYEELSDEDDLDNLLDKASEQGEDEEESKSKVVDALAIDWASLVKEPPATRPATAGSALKRFSPASVFTRIGVSRAFAGEVLYQRIKAKCQQQLDDEARGEAAAAAKVKVEVKTEPGEETADAKPSVEAEVKVKTEPGKEVAEATEVKPVVEPKKFTFLHDVAMLHTTALAQQKERAGLVDNIGPFRRALCARRDLMIRRKLCRAGVEHEDFNNLPAQVVDPDLYKQSLQLLRGRRAERKPAIPAFPESQALFI